MASKCPHSESSNGRGPGNPIARDELIGRLYASHQHGVAPIVAELSAAERANLALFCYQRAHLREIGLAIAATCDQWSLVNAAGRAGDVLFANSRTQPIAERTLPLGRRRITLASLAPSIAPSPELHDEADLDEADLVEADLVEGAREAETVDA